MTFYNCCYNLYHGVKGHVRIYMCFHRGSCQSSASYGTVSLLYCQCWVQAFQIHWVFGMCYQIWSWYFPQ